jgi:hypothetical protein
MLNLLAQSTDYLYETTSVPTADNGIAGIFTGSFMLLWLVVVVIAIVGMWKMFTKAGKPGWASIVPIYNIIVLLEIAQMPLWWLAVLLLSFIPFLGIFASLAFSIMVGINIAKRFGKSEVWGAILCGILSIGYLIIGFDSSKYQPETVSGPTDSTPSATDA